MRHKLTLLTAALCATIACSAHAIKSIPVLPDLYEADAAIYAPESEPSNSRLFVKPYRITRGSTWVELTGIGRTTGEDGTEHLTLSFRKKGLYLREVRIVDETETRLDRTYTSIKGDRIDLEYDMPAKDTTTLKRVHISADNAVTADREYGPVLIDKLKKPHKIEKGTWLMLADYRISETSPIAIHPAKTETDLGKAPGYRYLALHLYVAADSPLPPVMKFEIYGTDGLWRNLRYYPNWTTTADIWSSIGLKTSPTGEIEEITPGSPAEAAGVRKGETITRIDRGMGIPCPPESIEADGLRSQPLPGDEVEPDTLHTVGKDGYLKYIENDLPPAPNTSTGLTLTIKGDRREGCIPIDFNQTKPIAERHPAGIVHAFDTAVPNMRKLTLHRLTYAAAGELPSDYKILKIRFTNREAAITKSIDETLQNIPLPPGFWGE